MLATKSFFIHNPTPPTLDGLMNGSTLSKVVYGGYNHLTWTSSGSGTTNLVIGNGDVTMEALVVGGGGAGYRAFGNIHYFHSGPCV